MTKETKDGYYIIFEISGSMLMVNKRKRGSKNLISLLVLKEKRLFADQ
jgi:hypothetical protein